MAVVDVTVPLREGIPVYPGDPQLRLERLTALADGAVCNLSRLDCGVHTGTHVDAPVHFVEGAPGVEALSLDAMVGPAYVVDATEVTAHVDAATLEALDIPRGTTRVLFKTPNSRLWGRDEYTSEFVGLTGDAAHALVDRGVLLVGVDYLSVAPPDDPAPTHLALLRAGVVVLEGLDLRPADPGGHHLTCLPLLLVGADGAPARVVLARDEAGSTTRRSPRARLAQSPGRSATLRTTGS